MISIVLGSVLWWVCVQEDSRSAERTAMIESQIKARGVRDERVLKAMENVARHYYVPEGMRAHAYEDRPLPIGQGQTISQPYIVAAMTEMLDLQPEDRVLEVGTGSGYQAAILAEIAAQVYTIEIIAKLGEQAAEVLREQGYTNVHTKVGDGYLGWPEAAPFDAIIVTAAPDHIPQPLVEQLKVGGKMAIPVGPTFAEQKLVLLEKKMDGTLEKTTMMFVRFVPLTGVRNH